MVVEFINDKCYVGGLSNQARVLRWESGGLADITNNQTRYSYDNLVGSSQLEVGGDGNLIGMEEYLSVRRHRGVVRRKQTTSVCYSGKERDATGLYYYGYRYYQP